MTPREWAEQVQVHFIAKGASRLVHWPATRDEVERVIAAAVAEATEPLAAEVERLRRQVQSHCDRIAVQSELLSKRAEKPGVE